MSEAAKSYHSSGITVVYWGDNLYQAQAHFTKYGPTAKDNIKIILHTEPLTARVAIDNLLQEVGALGLEFGDTPFLDFDTKGIKLKHYQELLAQAKRIGWDAWRVDTENDN